MFVPDVSTHFLFFVVGGPRFRALGVDSGPRGGAFEGVLDPQAIITNIYIFISAQRAPTQRGRQHRVDVWGRSAALSVLAGFRCRRMWL